MQVEELVSITDQLSEAGRECRGSQSIRQSARVVHAFASCSRVLCATNQEPRTRPWPREDEINCLGRLPTIGAFVVQRLG